MSHILFCVQNLSVPQDTRVWREALALRQAGHRVSVICPRTSGGPWSETLEGVEIRRYPAPPELPGLLGQVVETGAALVCTSIRALSLRARNRIDALHGANPPDTFFLVAALLRPFGTRYVFDQHDLVPELLAARDGEEATDGPSRLGAVQRRVFGLLERASYRRADMVVTPNNSYRTVAVQRGNVDPERVITVRSGPDAVALPPTNDPAEVGAGSTNEHDEVPTIAFAGVIGPQDGVETLIDAIAALREMHDEPFRVEMIGRGSDIERLQQRADAAGTSDLITWTGWVGQDELRERLEDATVAVSPDVDNAFSRRSTMTKIAEYLALGVPAVIAELPENRFTAGEAAVYYEAGNATDMAKRLAELLSDAELRNQLSDRARRRAQGLVWAHSAARLVAAYEALLHDAPFPAGDQHIADES